MFRRVNTHMSHRAIDRHQLLDLHMICGWACAVMLWRYEQWGFGGMRMFHRHHLSNQVGVMIEIDGLHDWIDDDRAERRCGSVVAAAAV